jgi:hypothetical protein
VREAVFSTILPPPLALDPAAEVLQGRRHLEDTRDQTSVGRVKKLLLNYNKLHYIKHRKELFLVKGLVDI